MPAPTAARAALRRRLPTSVLALAVVLAAVACTAAADPDAADGTVLADRAAAELAELADATAIPAAPATAGAGAQVDVDTDLGPDLRHVAFAAGDPVVFTTGPGDRSWSIAVTAAAPGGLVGIRRVTDPAGEIRYLADLRDARLVEDELHPVVLADADAVGLYVTGPVGEDLPSGRWAVDVAGNDGAPAVRVVVRSGDPSVPQQLDVVVWATAHVPDPAAVADAWRVSADAVLAPHGIRVGRLDVVPAGAAGQPFAALGVDGLADEVHAACSAAQQAARPHPRTALVILADQIGEGVVTADAGGTPGVAYRRPDGAIQGFAVATPGTPVTGPASHACVAVAAGDDPAGQGLVALHEVLHQAGLTRHTTERTGREFDLLADTPECPLVRFDADGDRQVTRGECAAAGGDNLMFWAIGGETLTPEQAWRVRAHPLLRPAEQGR